MAPNNNSHEGSGDDVILQLHEAASFLKISEQQLYHAVCHGEIPGAYIAGQWRFSKSQMIQHCMRPIQDQARETYIEYIYHRYYRADWSVATAERQIVSLQEAAEAIELSEDQILEDMGEGLIHGLYQDSGWFFDYIDLCTYHHHYYMPGPDEPAADHELSAPIFKAQDVIQAYRSGRRDFSCLAVENQADFSRQNLSGIDLADCTLIQANFEGSNLAEADLRDADLGYTNFQNSILRRADLSGAQLYGANLRGADLSEAWLYQTQLEEITLNKGTVIRHTWLWPQVAVSRVG